MGKSYAFTKKYDNITHVLTLPVSISLIGSNGKYETQGIIDTGAICSVVSMNVVEKLGGIPFSYQFINTASAHNTLTPLYKAAVVLCGKLEITNLTVSDGILPVGEECLIGMDILALGDLAATHFDGKTCISFRIPSLQSIEFTEDS
ncbi:MAG: retroviral-like aspartic protease family protein [Prevotellaceae bacterium]|jgi:predicted aspartyl protease|nr:retroviral-like aspartic protease family protein [Prevotellaceae bacterium]